MKKRKPKNEYTRTYLHMIPGISRDTWYLMFESNHIAAQSTAGQGTAPHGAVLLSYSWAELSWECTF